MYTKLFLAAAILLLVGCGESAPTASEGFHTENYIEESDENNHTVIYDVRQNLEFVNSAQGCTPIHGTPEDALKNARYFCENLRFFGYDDWRVPTLQEIERLSKGMDREGLVPFFTFKQCKRIVGVKQDGTLGNINTHNIKPKFAEVPLRLPAGVRCVRER